MKKSIKKWSKRGVFLIYFFLVIYGFVKDIGNGWYDTIFKFPFILIFNKLQLVLSSGVSYLILIFLGALILGVMVGSTTKNLIKTFKVTKEVFEISKKYEVKTDDDQIEKTQKMIECLEKENVSLLTPFLLILLFLIYIGFITVIVSYIPNLDIENFKILWVDLNKPDKTRTLPILTILLMLLLPIYLRATIKKESTYVKKVEENVNLLIRIGMIFIFINSIFISNGLALFFTIQTIISIVRVTKQKYSEVKNGKVITKNEV